MNEVQENEPETDRETLLYQIPLLPESKLQTREYFKIIAKKKKAKTQFTNSKKIDFGPHQPLSCASICDEW